MRLKKKKQIYLLIKDRDGLLIFSKGQLDSLEERASNLIVASGSDVKDFAAEYQNLEDRISDIKKMSASNFTDRQLRALNESFQNI